MSKLGAAAATGIGGAGIAVGGVYLSQMFGVNPEIPSELDKFKKSDGGECIQGLFPGIISMTKSDLQDVSKDDGKLGNGANDPVDGCLIVNFDKWKPKDKKEDKWRGNLRFLWALAKGNVGFAVYFTADTPNPPPESNAKLKAKGVAYVLAKDESKNTWSINKGKDIDHELEVAKLPKPGTGLDQKDKDSQWKFAEKDSSLSKLCSASDCPDKKPGDEFFRGYWIWKKGDEAETTTADSWSSNLSDWWKEIYSEEEKWKMTEVLKNIKGKWMSKGVYATPEEKVIETQ